MARVGKLEAIDNQIKKRNCWMRLMTAGERMTRL